MSSPGSYPFAGKPSPVGVDNLNSLPSLSFNVSVSGLKLRLPAKVKATTRSGDVTKEWVAGFASLRPVKLRLYDERIELASPFLTSFRSHCPIPVESHQSRAFHHCMETLTRPAGVCQNHASKLLKCLELAIAGDRRSYLLRTRRNREH